MKDTQDGKTQELFSDLTTAIAKVQGKEVNIYASAPKSKTTNGFVMVFYDALSKHILDGKLAMTDMKVIMALCKIAEYGNTISLNQTKVAELIMMEKATFSRSITKLTKLGILLKCELGLFFNPALIVKGKLDKISNVMWESALDIGSMSPLEKIARKQKKVIEYEANQDIQQEEEKDPFEA
jgi:DNA-binding Lrp family transcriptional regulator